MGFQFEDNRTEKPVEKTLEDEVRDRLTDVLGEDTINKVLSDLSEKFGDGPEKEYKIQIAAGLESLDRAIFWFAQSIENDPEEELSPQKAIVIATMLQARAVLKGDVISGMALLSWEHRIQDETKYPDPSKDEIEELVENSTNMFTSKLLGGN